MPKIVIYEHIDLPMQWNFEDTTEEKMEKFIDSNNLIKFYDINNSKDLFTILDDIKKVKNCNSFMLSNRYYTKDTLIQTFITDDRTEKIFVKRKINENDSYTYIDIKVKNCECYEYLDVTKKDIIFLLREIFIKKGIMVTPSGMKEIEYVNFVPDGTEIKILNTSEGDISYCDYSVISNDYDEEFERVDEYDKSKCDFVAFYYDFGVGELRLYVQKEANEKNTIISNLVKKDIFGTVFVGLCDKMNVETQNYNLNLDIDLFNTIIQKIDVIKKTEPKVDGLYNIYRVISLIA